jgi:hypothetical protein
MKWLNVTVVDYLGVGVKKASENVISELRSKRQNRERRKYE